MQALLDDLPDDLRVRALTHPAFARSRDQSYERLEFLGDSVLGLAVTDELYRRFPELPEGDLTRIRAATVSRDSCAHVAREHGLGEAMQALAQAEGSAQGASAERLKEQRNALAALTESVLGAGFLALGYEAVARRIVAAFAGRIEHALANRVDARSQLQELASRSGAAVAFDEVGEDGPPHDRRFTVLATIGGTSAQGSGRSKQEAQQAASAALLALIDQDQG